MRIGIGFIRRYWLYVGTGVDTTRYFIEHCTPALSFDTYGALLAR
jgi:hypothetical protein